MPSDSAHEKIMLSRELLYEFEKGYETPDVRSLSPDCVAFGNRTNLHVGCHVLFVSRPIFGVGT